uniref:(northern house mosquito) hypothetical protein n=1 Tax=Culex pipiens TaxID=7175 RepID=A0A8D8C0N6_CULPI
MTKGNNFLNPFRLNFTCKKCLPKIYSVHLRSKKSRSRTYISTKRFAVQLRGTIELGGISRSIEILLNFYHTHIKNSIIKSMEKAGCRESKKKHNIDPHSFFY